MLVIFGFVIHTSYKYYNLLNCKMKYLLLKFVSVLRIHFAHNFTDNCIHIIGLGLQCDTYRKRKVGKN